ncbi:MAG: ABC transporter permease [Opitutales bacterium]|nr:ABC transporter permease [Opitutales bacterium]
MTKDAKARYVIEEDGGRPILRLSGKWSVGSGFPSPARIARELAAAAKKEKFAVIDLDGVTSFDSTLPAFLVRLREEWRAGELKTVSGAEKVDALERLAEAGRRNAANRDKPQASRSLVERLGQASITLWREHIEVCEFCGRTFTELCRLAVGRSSMRAGDFFHVLRTVTVQALPIVSLISLLVGFIIAFLGAVVLRRFGAEFAVSYLVGYGMLREMGAVMAGVIMAGRTGAGFAAEIGSMKVNEEIDALETFSIPSFGFIVLPRVLALAIALPLLTIYANVVGILGGYLVADFMMGVPRSIFFSEMIRVIGIADLLLGVTKGFVFGLLIAFAGCLRGLQCGGGAQAVGVAATRAVVLGITLIIIFNALIDYIAATLNI